MAKIVGGKNSFKIKSSNMVGSKYTFIKKGKGKGNPCTGTEALYRPYSP